MKLNSLFNKVLFIAATTASSATFAHNGMTYDEPYARATPPSAVNSAIFMTIENHMGKDRTIISAKSNVAETTELHTVEKQGDIMKMRQVEQITVPAHGEVQLQPGSFHIMLLGVTQPLVEGETTEVTLSYADGETKTLTVPVKKVMSGMKMQKHHTQDHATH